MPCFWTNRRGIGKQLLKACEDLIFKMNARRRVYLHCRIIDQVPFNMYRKAGYIIVQTDSILVWLNLQKRKYLMSKELPQASVVSETSTKNFDDNIWQAECATGLTGTHKVDFLCIKGFCNSVYHTFPLLYSLWWNQLPFIIVNWPSQDALKMSW